MIRVLMGSSLQNFGYVKIRVVTFEKPHHLLPRGVNQAPLELRKFDEFAYIFLEGRVPLLELDKFF